MRFGEMLLERRRQRGLSIQQVANIIKIRPQIIEYFECENFAAMPPRGYAQGMIASYARYLGLNPREVVSAYFDSLHAFEQQAAGTGVGRYHESVTDASPRSANTTGRFLMVNSGPASSRFATRPPQAGYVSESTSPHEPLAAQRLRPAPARPRAAGTGRDGAMRGPGRADRRPTGPSDRRRQMGSMRGDYRASDRRGSSRRPGGAGAAGSTGRRPSRQAPAPLAFDPRLLIGAAIGLVAIVILLTVLVMRGCAPAAAPVQGSTQADASTSSKDTSGASADASDDSGSDADAAGDAADTGTDDADGTASGDAADSEPTETVVKVSISGKGTVAWLEVKLDGKSVLASQEVGPFEQEFTVTQQIEITTDKPSDVTVTKNGKKVRYDTKVSGVGKVTITAPQKTDGADTAADQSADASDTDTGDASGQAAAQQ